MNGQNPALSREVIIGVVATVLFFLSMMLIPVVGIAAGVFAPLPTLISCCRWGRPAGYFVPAGAAVVGSVVLSYLGAAPSIPYYCAMLCLGLLLGTGVRQQWSLEKTIAGSSLAVFGMGAAVFWFTFSGAEGGMVKYLENDLKGAVSLAIQQYATGEEEKRILEEAFHAIVPVLVRMLPGAALASALFISWLNLLVMKRTCPVFGLPVPQWGEWSRWKAPEQFVWAVIGGGFLLFVPSSGLRFLAANVLLVLGTVYLFQGLAIAAFYFEKWKLPRFLRAVIYAFLLLQQFATLGVILVGLFDIWLDFRRLSRKAPLKEE